MSKSTSNNDEEEDDTGAVDDKSHHLYFNVCFFLFYIFKGLVLHLLIILNLSLMKSKSL